ncbi:MAG: glycosyltransferase family 4 protein [Microlunatus sp.]|nr:glycosyltransferase family 4 protein [Microlunatus sp.]MDN5778307.1 glycosyltransferase family 4 protein [Humibacillus sp.]
MGTPLKVVYLDHCALMSGGEIALLRLIEALGDRVAAHVVLAEQGPIADLLEQAGADVEILPLAEGVRSLHRDNAVGAGFTAESALELGRYTRSLGARLRKLRPDIVHTNSLKSALYGGVAGRLAGRPVLWHIRDRIAGDYLSTPAVAMVRALSLALPSVVLTNSRSTASTLPRHSEVVYDVVSFESPAAPLPERTGPVTLGMMGRLAAWKGQHIFLDAFARVAQDRAVRAKIIGSAMFGEQVYERELHEQVERLGIAELVEFRGFRPDVEAEIAALDVVVHASVSPEPFGQVVIEAMALRRPVIAARAGGPSEVITDGHDGLLVSPGDVTGYAEAMRRLIDDPRLGYELAEAGLRTSQRYRPEAIAEQMMNVYARMA